MIEVMFGESEGGAMKMAKNYQKPDYNNGAIGWIGKKPSKEELDKMFEGHAIGGNSSEVVCIPFMLDNGYINVPIESEYRKKLILDMYTINGINDKNTLKDLDETWGKYLVEIERLKKYATLGEDIRLWYSDAPYSVCGFYYVCNLLKDYNCKVFVIKLPKYMQLSDDEIQYYISWGEIAAGKFYKFLHLEKELSYCELRYFASNWFELMEENSTLRAIVNGRVIGVPEDFYDNIIKKRDTRWRVYYGTSDWKYFRKISSWN